MRQDPLKNTSVTNEEALSSTSDYDTDYKPTNCSSNSTDQYLKTNISKSSSQTRLEQQSKLISKSNQYKCTHQNCLAEFKRRDALERHEFTHTGVKKFNCTIDGCDKSYTNDSHLRRHVRAFHTQQTPRIPQIECQHENCVKKFTTNTSMVRHYKVTHLGEKMIKCDLCNEQFQRKNQLKVHKFQHDGNYPYKCCDIGFLNLKSYRRHQTTHNNNKQKEYKCKDCQEIFYKWSKIVLHRRQIHRPKCTICDKEFSNKITLKIHLNVHNRNEQEQKVYPCTYDGCPKYYFYLQNLRFHLCSKHGETDKYNINTKFECDKCGAKLVNKTKLQLHWNWHIRTGITKKIPIEKRERLAKVSMAVKLANIVQPRMNSMENGNLEQNSEFEYTETE